MEIEIINTQMLKALMESMSVLVKEGWYLNINSIIIDALRNYIDSTSVTQQWVLNRRLSTTTFHTKIGTQLMLSTHQSVYLPRLPHLNNFFPHGILINPPFLNRGVIHNSLYRGIVKGAFSR
jgi:hypothetical protein